MSKSEWVIWAKRILHVNHHQGLNKAPLSSVSLDATDFTAYRSEEQKEGQRRGGKEEGPVGSCSGGQGSSCGTPTFRTIDFS